MLSLHASLAISTTSPSLSWRRAARRLSSPPSLAAGWVSSADNCHLLMVQVNPMIMEVGREGINTGELIKVLEAGTCISCLKMLLEKCCFNLSKQRARTLFSLGAKLLVQISKLQIWLSQFHKVSYSLGLSKRILLVMDDVDIRHFSR